MEKLPAVVFGEQHFFIVAENLSKVFREWMDITKVRMSNAEPLFESLLYSGFNGTIR